MAEIGAVNSLVSELLAAGRAKANNVAKLLAMLSACKQEAATKAAIQGLKQFFVAAGQDGLLVGARESGSRPAKRQKVAADGNPAGDAEAQYRDWLNRQYGTFVNQLLALATGAPTSTSVTTAVASRSAGLQVLAAAALMDCARSELGPGVFSGELYGRLLAAVLVSPSVRPEVFSLLFTKYLPMADVRFYTLATVKAIADRYSKAAAAAPAPEAEEEDEDEGAGSRAAAAAAVSAVATATAAADEKGSAGDGGGGGGGSGGGAAVSIPDLARNAYDILCHVTDTLPPDTREWRTWCGAAEYNLVAAAADKNESARLRRKRQQQEQQQQQQQQQQQSQQQQQQQRKVAWANLLTQRRLYGDAWLSLLSLPLPADVLRKALVRLPVSVIPHMTSPQLLADFLTHCLNRGGLTGMLALNGLFLLVTRHGLEYPQFYARLYQLLVPEAFAARTRAQFFRLADIFLSSGLVPAYTVAAFAKRFARLALVAPPAGAMIAIAFIHNLLRRHPALYVMLHNPHAASAEQAPQAATTASATATARAGVDPYDEAEADPAKSRAVESSLWEVEALRNHYCPQVSTFCVVLDKDLTDRVKTAEVNLEDLLGTAAKEEGQHAGGAGSYNALIHGELSRKLRKAPVAFYNQAPASLFATSFDAEDWAGWALDAGGL